MNAAKERISLLNCLLSYNTKITDLESSLAKFRWDSEELVKLENKHLKNILNRYINGTLSLNEIEDWANAIECRDDIDYSSFIEIIHELANPLLHSELTEFRAREILNLLRTKKEI